MAYATGTTVSEEKSRREIEGLLRRYGCGEFAYSWTLKGSQIGFTMRDRSVRFVLPTPALDDFLISPGGRGRTDAQARTAQEQAVRARWRALKLVIHAKLEAVEAGISTLEEEFLAHIVTNTGETVAERMLRPGGDVKLLEAPKAAR